MQLTSLDVCGGCSAAFLLSFGAEKNVCAGASENEWGKKQQGVFHRQCYCVQASVAATAGNMYLRRSSKGIQDIGLSRKDNSN